ncbi:MAG: hypothetical protein GY867_07580, partial [bacterium]|nr:hypothetical protein [bacterium]
FEQDPATYEKPIEKELGQLIQADSDFAAQLKPLLEQLRPALKTYRATQTGSGLLVQGEQSTGVQQEEQGQAAIHSRIGGDMIASGAHKTVFVTAQAFWQQYPASPQLSAAGLQQATERYLTHLLDRYRYLDFKGMGVSDRVALRMPLLEMYVPLKARIEMPEGETWSRELRLAGRQVSPEEAEVMGRRLSEPQPLLELLKQHEGLIILGDPGAGKTTFLKYLTLRLALGQGESLNLG